MAHSRIDTLQSAKSAAEGVRNRSVALGIDMKLGQAYEMVAAVQGYRNWATMKSALESSRDAVTADQAIAPTSPDTMTLDQRLAALNASAVGLGLYPADIIDIHAEADSLDSFERKNGLAGSNRNDVAALLRLWKGNGLVSRMQSDFFRDWLWEEGNRLFGKGNVRSAKEIAVKLRSETGVQETAGAQSDTSFGRSM